MSEMIKVNFSLQPETIDQLEKLCKETFRTKSDMLDYLVHQEYGRRYSQPNPVITVEEALAQTSETVDN